MTQILPFSNLDESDSELDGEAPEAQQEREEQRRLAALNAASLGATNNIATASSTIPAGVDKPKITVNSSVLALNTSSINSNLR